MKLFGNSHNAGHDGGHHSAPGETAKPAAAPARAEKSQTAKPAAPAQDAAAMKKKKALRRTFIILAAVVLTVLAVVVAYAIWEKPPEIASPTPTVPGVLPPNESGAPGVTPTNKPGETEDPSVTGAPEDGEDTGDAPTVAMSSDRKDGVYTILMVGVDKASSSTDTIMVVSFDTKNHTLTGTSIPRDTLVNIGWYTTPKKINAIYPGFLNNGQSGIDGLKMHVKSLLGFDVDSYVVVSLQAVEEAVDAIGGVEFDVPQAMHYRAPDQGLYIDIPAGRQVLNGENALKLCRFRSDYAEGDLRRIEVQHDFLKAMASQMIKKGIPNLPELIDVVMRNVETDLKAENIAWFARQFLKCKDSDVTFQTAPNSGSGINDISYVGLIVDQWLKMVNESINPYKDDVTVANVNILTFDGAGGVYSTTGAVAGGIESFYCITCTVKNHGEGVYHAPGAHLTFEGNGGTAQTIPAETGGPEIITVPSDDGGNPGGNDDGMVVDPGDNPDPGEG